MLSDELSLYYKNDEYNLNSKIFDKNKLSKENTTDNEMNQKAQTSKEDQEDEEILLNGIRSRFARLEERASKSISLLQIDTIINEAKVYILLKYF